MDPTFRPGDGIEISDTKQRGDIVSVDDSASTATIALLVSGDSSSSSAAPRLVVAPFSGITHLLPPQDGASAPSSCGGFPYQPTGEDRQRFADTIGWQKHWKRENHCGGWCCYSFECGALTCSACHKSCIWPCCPSCGSAFGSAFSSPGAIPERCPFKSCGADISSIRSGCYRYVCAKQIAVQVGPPEKNYVLNPTFCTVYCQSCWRSGELTHAHDSFVEIDPTGEHRPVTLPPLSLARVAHCVEKWQQVFKQWNSVNREKGKELHPGAAEIEQLHLSSPDSEAAIRRVYSLFNDDINNVEAYRALLAASAPVQVVKNDPRVDCITYCEIEAGEEFVQLHLDCKEHVYSVDTLPMLLKSDSRSNKPEFYLTCSHPDHDRKE